MSPLHRIAPFLRCPVCRAEMTVDGALRCGRGHAFDIAKQGYVNLLGGNTKRHGKQAARNADTAAMIEARQRFLAAGHYAPLATALRAQVTDSTGLVLDVGSGSGEYLAAVLDDQPGLALDISVPAVRKAARIHPGIGAVVTDLRATLPLADGVAATVLNVFSPRNAAEYRRVLRHDGRLLVVTPGGAHLGELIGALGLISVAEDKDDRLAAALGAHFRLHTRDMLRRTMKLSHEEVTDLVLMGPNAHHVEPAELSARIAELPTPVPVTAEFTLSVYHPALRKFA